MDGTSRTRHGEGPSSSERHQSVRPQQETGQVPDEVVQELLSGAMEQAEQALEEEQATQQPHTPMLPADLIWQQNEEFHRVLQAHRLRQVSQNTQLQAPYRYDMGPTPMLPADLIWQQDEEFHRLLQANRLRQVPQYTQLPALYRYDTGPTDDVPKSGAANPITQDLTGAILGIQRDVNAQTQIVREQLLPLIENLRGRMVTLEEQMGRLLQISARCYHG